MRKIITVSVSSIDDESIKIIAGEVVIEIKINSSIAVNSKRLDFAVWYVLPIAMSCDSDILVEGAGSQNTIDNAYKMSQIWASWMPSRFTPVNVSFTEVCDDSKYKTCSGKLCFYSGGVDSTYSILKLNEIDERCSLLTVHGMDYKYSDEQRFNELVSKTKYFSEKFGEGRLFLKTNIYSVYRKYEINTRTSHITHIFALAGSAFLFSENFEQLIISSDHRLDQQFSIHPWGSNSATNFLFDDGSTFLITVDDDVTRSEKLLELLNDQIALSSLSFCVNYKSRPHNCGICSKCMRTKLMFFALTGEVPDVFIEKNIDDNALSFIDLTKKNERAFFMDLYFCAKNNGTLDSMPYLQVFYEKLKCIDSESTTISSKEYFKKLKRKLFKI